MGSSRTFAGNSYATKYVKEPKVKETKVDLGNISLLAKSFKKNCHKRADR